MIYGYPRISTKKQSIERQIRNIKATYPDAFIVAETYTGTELARPEWTKLYKMLKPGDTVVFDEVSRMSRNAEEGFALYKELFEKGIDLVFLKEPHINTSTYRESANNSIAMTGNDIADIYIEATNKVLMILIEKQIRLAFEQAQKEVDYLHQRTKEGLHTARLNGRMTGSPKGTKYDVKKSREAKEKIKKYCKDFDGTLNDKDTIVLVGVSAKTYYKYKKELREESGDSE